MNATNLLPPRGSSLTEIGKTPSLSSWITANVDVIVLPPVYIHYHLFLFKFFFYLYLICEWYLRKWQSCRRTSKRRALCDRKRKNNHAWGFSLRYYKKKEIFICMLKSMITGQRKGRAMGDSSECSRTWSRTGDQGHLQHITKLKKFNWIDRIS